MARALVPDSLWETIKPLLPPDKPPKSNGRPAVPNRQALVGILFVLRTGIPWSYLPTEMGCGSGVTCWRRLRDWQKAGVWDTVYETLLAHLREENKIDWSRTVVDSASVRAVFGGSRPARTLQTGAKPAPSIIS
jgi:transposase